MGPASKAENSCRKPFQAIIDMTKLWFQDSGSHRYLRIPRTNSFLVLGKLSLARKLYNKISNFFLPVLSDYCIDKFQDFKEF